MVLQQKQCRFKEVKITEQDSLLLTRNLLRIIIFMINISYIRGLFPEKYFNDKSVPALGVLQKKYCVRESIKCSMIEEYSFSFSYSSTDSQEVSMNFNRSGNKKNGGTFKYNSTTEITPNQMRSSACKMIRTLVQLMRTLDKMPEERTILMKLLCYDDVTPVDYEPPFFRVCTEEEAHNPWTKSPLKMEVGNVNSKHFVLALKVKSVLDPCEDENDDMEEDEVSLGAETEQKSDSSDSDSEANQSQENEFIVPPVDKECPEEDTGMVDQDDTQDPDEDEQQMVRVKDWIAGHHLDTMSFNDILSNFPDISEVLTEEIIDKLVKEGVLSKTGTDRYTKNNQKKSDFEFSLVKEEMDGQAIPNGNKTPRVDDHMYYIKALYHALPLKFVTATKLQSKLDGETNQTTVCKLIDRMTRDGYLEAKGNRRLGKHVIRSVQTENRLIEVKKILENGAMDVDKDNDQQMKSDQAALQRNSSTCGVLHSIGSDLTRIKIQSDINNNGLIRSDQTTSKKTGNTPTSRAENTCMDADAANAAAADEGNGLAEAIDDGEEEEVVDEGGGGGGNGGGGNGGVGDGPGAGGNAGNADTGEVHNEHVITLVVRTPHNEEFTVTHLLHEEKFNSPEEFLEEITTKAITNPAIDEAAYEFARCEYYNAAGEVLYLFEPPEEEGEGEGVVLNPGEGVVVNPGEGEDDMIVDWLEDQPDGVMAIWADFIVMVHRVVVNLENDQ